MCPGCLLCVPWVCPGCPGCVFPLVGHTFAVILKVFYSWRQPKKIFDFEELGSSSGARELGALSGGGEPSPAHHHPAQPCHAPNPPPQHPNPTTPAKPIEHTKVCENQCTMLLFRSWFSAKLLLPYGPEACLYKVVA